MRGSTSLGRCGGCFPFIGLGEFIGYILVWIAFIESWPLIDIGSVAAANLEGADMTILERPGIDSDRHARYARWRFYSYERRPLFVADWTGLVFHHFKVDRQLLEPEVPFELDAYENDTYVSLVGFKTTRMYVERLGEWTHWIHRPLSHHAFLNVRTYVQHRGEPGIFFLKEYVNSRPAIPVGRHTYGLPYSFAHLHFDHGFEETTLAGQVKDVGGASLSYEGTQSNGDGLATCPVGTRREFLCERYSAFTSAAGIKRVFRILHKPWRVVSVESRWLDFSLLLQDFDWFGSAEFVGSFWTPGVRNVRISRPRLID